MEFRAVKNPHGAGWHVIGRGEFTQPVAAFCGKGPQNEQYAKDHARRLNFPSHSPATEARKKSCENCHFFGICRWSCTCIANTLTGSTGKHKKFFFCSVRCVAMHHEGVS